MVSRAYYRPIDNIRQRGAGPRTGKIDNIWQGGGGRKKRRSRRRKRCNVCNKPKRRRRQQRGDGIKKQLAGKALSFLAKNAGKGLDFVSSRVKNKKVKSLLNNSLVRHDPMMTIRNNSDYEFSINILVKYLYNVSSYFLKNYYFLTF